MINYKRLLIVFTVLLVLISSSYLFLSRDMANGLLAGFLLGVLNFYLIVFTVKRFLVRGGEKSAGKAILSVFIYFMKLVLLALVVGTLIVLRKYFNLYGIIIGFTVCLSAVGIEGLIAKNKS